MGPVKDSVGDQSWRSLSHYIHPSHPTSPLAMRVRTLEIRWHNGDPIYSCDFQPLPQSQLKKTIAPRIVHKESSTPSSSEQKATLPPPPPPPTAATSASASSTTNTNYGVGQSFRFATGGSDNNVRVRICVFAHPLLPLCPTQRRNAFLFHSWNNTRFYSRYGWFTPTFFLRPSRQPPRRPRAVPSPPLTHLASNTSPRSSNTPEQ